MRDRYIRDLVDNLLIEQATKIVSAYVGNNAISAADLPALITNTCDVLQAVLAGRTKASEKDLSPAVFIEKSVTPDFIICLEDGKKFKIVKRHLAGLGMTPDDYRAKWGLPFNYPMVAPNYSIARSQIAKDAGLGLRLAVQPVTVTKGSKTPKPTPSPSSNDFT